MRTKTTFFSLEVIKKGENSTIWSLGKGTEKWHLGISKAQRNDNTVSDL